MVIFFLQILFFQLIKSSFQSKNVLNEPIIYSNNKEIYFYEEEMDISILTNCSSYTENTQILICLLNVTRDNSEAVKKLFLNEKFRDIIIRFLSLFIDKEIYGFFNDLVTEFFNTSKSYIDDFFGMIKMCEIKSPCIVDFLINIIKFRGYPGKYTTYFVFENICDVLNYPGFEKLIKALDNSGTFIFIIFKSQVKISTFSEVYSYLENLINNYSGVLNTFIYDIFKSFKNLTNTIDLYYDFISNNSDFVESMEELFKNKMVLKALSEAIYYDDEVINELKNIILKDTEIIAFYISIIQDKPIINATLALLRNVENDDLILLILLLE